MKNWFFALCISIFLLQVIKETETTYDVRFFGGKYERSILPKNKKNVLPIEIKPKNHEVNIKLAHFVQTTTSLVCYR